MRIKAGTLKNQAVIFANYDGEKHVIMLMNIIEKHQEIALNNQAIERL